MGKKTKLTKRDKLILRSQTYLEGMKSEFAKKRKKKRIKQWNKSVQSLASKLSIGNDC